MLPLKYETLTKAFNTGGRITLDILLTPTLSSLTASLSLAVSHLATTLSTSPLFLSVSSFLSALPFLSLVPQTCHYPIRSNIKYFF